jgi:hypothetical protein
VVGLPKEVEEARLRPRRRRGHSKHWTWQGRKRRLIEQLWRCDHFTDVIVQTCGNISAFVLDFQAQGANSTRIFEIDEKLPLFASDAFLWCASKDNPSSAAEAGPPFPARTALR